MILKIFTDGGSKGNPGPSAIGIVGYTEEGKEILRHREDIGRATNNEAEYTAVIKALELIHFQISNFKFQINRIDFYSDSRLMVNQLNGLFKIKKAHIRNFVFKVRILESELRLPVYYHHIRREENKVADALVNGNLKDEI